MALSILDPVKCEKCGNDDPDKMICEPSSPVRAVPGPPKVRRVSHIGHRCSKCGHVTKLQTR